MAIETKPPAGPATDEEHLTPKRIERAEDELGWWFCERDAAMGKSGVGFEGGSVSVWDDQRSARAHGFHVAEGRILVAGGGRTGHRHRLGVARESKVMRAFPLLSADDQNQVTAAWSTANASRRVADAFNAREVSAPLIGLGLVIWYERKDDETRAPTAVLAQWDALCVNKASVMSELRRAAEIRYLPILGRYNAIREARNEADGEGRRAREEARRKRNEEFAARLRGDA